jgi:hypothetical protein
MVFRELGFTVLEDVLLLLGGVTEVLVLETDVGLLLVEDVDGLLLVGETALTDGLTDVLFVDCCAGRFAVDEAGRFTVDVTGRFFDTTGFFPDEDGRDLPVIVLFGEVAGFFRETGVFLVVFVIAGFLRGVTVLLVDSRFFVEAERDGFFRGLSGFFREETDRAGFFLEDDRVFPLESLLVPEDSVGRFLPFVERAGRFLVPDGVLPFLPARNPCTLPSLPIFTVPRFFAAISFDVNESETEYIPAAGSAFW